MKMNKLGYNYIVLIFILLLSSCASKTYEWVKVNPDKVAKSKSGRAYSESVKHVSVYVNAKHKEENVIYVENSADYFNSQPYNTNNSENRFSGKSGRRERSFVSDNVVRQTKAKPAFVKNSKKKIVADEEVSMSKLNSGLILPKKKKPVKSKNTSTEIRTLTEEGFDASSNITREVEDLGYDNGLKQLESQDLEIKNNEIKELVVESNTHNQVKEEAAKRNSFMWIGLVLLIVGLIVGLIFGRFAYFISVIGVVLLVIGYLTKT